MNREKGLLVRLFEHVVIQEFVIHKKNSFQKKKKNENTVVTLVLYIFKTCQNDPIKS